MDPVHERVLTVNRVFIMKNLDDVYAVMDYLIAGDIITTEEKELIEVATTATRRKQVLLDVIVTRGGRAFDILMQAFNDGYQHIYLELRKSLEKLKQSSHVQNISTSVEKVENPVVPTANWLSELTDAERRRTVTEKELSEVANHIGNIVFIGKKMGYSQGQIEQFQSYSLQSIPVQASKMFSSWRSRQASHATVEAFIKILMQSNVDIAPLKGIFVKKQKIQGTVW